MQRRCRIADIAPFFDYIPSTKLFKVRLDGGGRTVYNPCMELVQIRNLFAELKKKTSDLRGFL
jgi:hypothetical protein